MEGTPLGTVALASTAALLAASLSSAGGAAGGAAVFFSARWACLGAAAWAAAAALAAALFAREHSAAARAAAERKLRSALAAGAAALGVSAASQAEAARRLRALLLSLSLAAAVAVAAATLVCFPQQSPLDATGRLAAAAWAWLADVRCAGGRAELLAALAVGAYSLAFWPLAAAFAALDFAAPQVLRPFKVQHGQRMSTQMYAKCAGMALLNSALSFVLVHAVASWRRPDWSVETLPSAATLLLQLAASACASELWFYCGHRVMHLSDWLYNNVHYLHHQISAPSAVAALYAHPVEHALVNFPTTALGPVLLGGHASLYVLWTFVATVTVCLDHAGWHLPLLPAPEFHDFHHSEGVGNYGAVGLMDAALRTAEKYTWSSWQGAVAAAYVSVDWPLDKAIQMAKAKLIYEEPAPPTERADAPLLSTLVIAAEP